MFRWSGSLHNHAARHRGRTIVRAVPCAFALGVLLLLPATSAAAARCQPPDACEHGLVNRAPQELEARVARGLPVFETCVRLAGPLVLEPSTGAVAGPVVVRDSCVAGGIRARSTDFREIVDLSGTTIEGASDFYSAQFERVAEFAGTQFEGAAGFGAASFRGVARFFSTDFAKGVSMTDASFGGTADFDLMETRGAAMFDSVDLQQPARFSSAHFHSLVSFEKTRFGSGADFTETHFDGRADFDTSTAQGDLQFQESHFDGTDVDGATFNTVLYDGAADFSDSHRIHGNAIFDDAVISSLDLEGADAVYFGSPLRIDELRIGRGGVARLQLPGEPQDRIGEYGLIENATRSADDLGAANEARVRRRALERSSEGTPVRQLDWAFAWGVGGYFVRPMHPALALATLFLAGLGVRTLMNRRARRTWPARLRGVAVDAGGAFRAFRRIKAEGPTSLLQVEVLLYTVLVLVLIANLEAVSPPIRNLVEGLL